MYMVSINIIDISDLNITMGLLSMKIHILIKTNWYTINCWNNNNNIIIAEIIFKTKYATYLFE